MAYTRIASIDVTFADSFARAELKVCEKRTHLDGKEAKKGVGEKRVYCGYDKTALNEFFGFHKEDDLVTFFIQKDDLVEYFKMTERELKRPSFKYGKGKSTLINIRNEYQEKIDKLDDGDRLEFKFKYTYDSQNRYYLCLPRRSKKTQLWHDNWDYIRDICLPRVSRLLFMKLSDAGDNIIYIKPYYGSRLTTRKVDPSGTYEISPRSGQARYRQAIFRHYPSCVVTGAKDQTILAACHIMPYSECKINAPSMKYSEYNGLTMTPTIHKLFDLGYLSFELDGSLMLSDFLSEYDRDRLHLNDDISKLEFDEKTKENLKWHNENIFIHTSKYVKLK